jgi:hypothetical protein
MVGSVPGMSMAAAAGLLPAVQSDRQDVASHLE